MIGLKGVQDDINMSHVVRSGELQSDVSGSETVCKVTGESRSAPPQTHSVRCFHTEIPAPGPGYKFLGCLNWNLFFSF